MKIGKIQIMKKDMEYIQDINLNIEIKSKKNKNKNKFLKKKYNNGLN